MPGDYLKLYLELLDIEAELRQLEQEVVKSFVLEVKTTIVEPLNS